MLMTPIPLAELIDAIGEVADDLTIFAENVGEIDDLTPAVAAMDASAAPAGMRYLLEVDLAKEAITVWSHWRGRRAPTLREKVDAVLYYASHDAFAPVE